MTISRRLYLFVALVVVGCALVVRWAFLELPSVEDPEQRRVLTETARAFLQLGALGTLGALVKYAVDQISAARVERSAALTFKKDMLNRFRQVHQAVRTVPYLMEQESSAAAYHEGMRRLLDARTALTDVGSDLRVSNLPLLDGPELHDSIGKMIWYLSELLQESVDKSTETWDEILALDHFGPYRRATLTFAGEKEQDYMVRYDTHYEDAKNALAAALAPLG